MTKAPVRFEADEFDEWSHTPYDSGSIAAHVNSRLADYFKDAKPVLGYVGTEYSSWSTQPEGSCIQESHTHRAYLVGIEPISRGVSKEEIVSRIRSNAGVKGAESFLLELADVIEREGIK